MRQPWTFPTAWEFVLALRITGLSILLPTQRHADVAGQIINSAEFPHLCGNLLHDAHTAILLREHGIGRICTRDTDFNQFSFLKVIDPVRPQHMAENFVDMMNPMAMSRELRLSSFFKHPDPQRRRSSQQSVIVAREFESLSAPPQKLDRSKMQRIKCADRDREGLQGANQHQRDHFD